MNAIVIWNTKNSKTIILVFLSIVITIYFIVPKITNIAESAITSKKGGLFELGVILFSLVFALVWFLLILKSKYLKALLFQILVLPFTVKAVNAFAIVAYDPGGYFKQKISLTTFLIFVFLFFLLLRKDIVVPRHSRLFRIFEKLIWTFAGITTVTQFISHKPFSAFWLSIGGVWQYVALFYIVITVIKKKEDIHSTLKFVIYAFLLGIISRFGFLGITFLQQNSEASLSYIRLGTEAFGPAVSYGGYLAFVIIISFYFLSSSKKAKEEFIWIIVIGVLFFELLNTFTRGGILSIFFLALLPFWKTERKFFIKIIILILFLSPIIAPSVIRLTSMRELYLDARLIHAQGVFTRFNLYIQSIPFIFLNKGFGQGIGNLMEFMTITGHYRVSHNLLLQMTQTIGFYATLVFVTLYIMILFHIFKASKDKDFMFNRISIFLFIALMAWFFFANTTSTSILYYYPYEATIIFYTVLFVSVYVISEHEIYLNRKKLTVGNIETTF